MSTTTAAAPGEARAPVTAPWSWRGAGGAWAQKSTPRVKTHGVKTPVEKTPRITPRTPQWAVIRGIVT